MYDLKYRQGEILFAGILQLYFLFKIYYNMRC